jgi:hypothetical protein
MKQLAFLNSVFALTVGLMMFSSEVPAKADANAAFCLNAYGTSGLSGCNYYTLAQCRAAASGVAGQCVANSLTALARQRGRAVR